MTIIEPYDDEEMVYDKENHRYKLTQAGAKKVPYTTSFYGSEIDFYLDDMSETVYQYIYDVANKNNVPYIEFRLACDESLRPYVKRMLISQLKYDAQSKGNDLAHDTLMDKDADYYNRRVPINVKTMITNLGLDYAGNYNMVMPSDRYERWGY